MNIAEINPYIRLAIHSELPAPFYIKRRIIFDYELIYIEGGEMTLTYDDRDYPCKEGDILLLCPGVPHSFNVSTTTLIQPHIHFDMKYDPQSEQIYICYKDYNEMNAAERAMIRENIFPAHRISPFLKISEKKKFLKTMFEIIDSSDSSNPVSVSNRARMLFLIDAILSENTSILSQKNPRSSGISTHIRAFIQANYRQNITLEVLEQHFGYSKFYIEKTFKNTYGISVINYRNRKRMDAALYLLEKHSVSETASLLGYSSIYAFSNAFRSFYGVSPTTYLKSKDDTSDS